MHSSLLLLAPLAATAASAASLQPAIKDAAAPFSLVAKRQQQDPNTPLFLNSPACDYYQCNVTTTWGAKLVANWLNAPEGNVVLDLMTNNSADLAYNVATVPGTSQAGYCDAGYGLGVAVVGTQCGRFEWIVPASWAPGNYTLRASSQNQPNVASYTDVILLYNNLTNTDPKATFASVRIDGAPTATQTAGNNFQPTPQPTAATAPGAAAPSPTGTSAPASSSAAPAASGTSSTGSHSSASAPSAAPSNAAAHAGRPIAAAGLLGAIAVIGALLF